VKVASRPMGAQPSRADQMVSPTGQSVMPLLVVQPCASMALRMASRLASSAALPSPRGAVVAVAMAAMPPGVLAAPANEPGRAAAHAAVVERRWVR